MVIRSLLILQLLAGPLWAGEEPASPARTFQGEAGDPVEDFFTISVISLPFTALWSFVGATAVAALAQQRFPPHYDEPLLYSAAGAALGASLLIGAVSVSWGERRSGER